MTDLQGIIETQVRREDKSNGVQSRTEAHVDQVLGSDDVQDGIEPQVEHVIESQGVQSAAESKVQQVLGSVEVHSDL